MRRIGMGLCGLAIVCFGWASARGAEPQSKTATTNRSPAELRAEMHRTVADLIEAQAAEKPDADRVARLKEKAQSLRMQLGPMGPGRGPGWGGGRGAGWGGGRGPGWGGRGPACPAWGPGWGRGAGWGGGFLDEDHDGVCDNYQRMRGAKD